MILYFDYLLEFGCDYHDQFPFQIVDFKTKYAYTYNSGTDYDDIEIEDISNYLIDYKSLGIKYLKIFVLVENGDYLLNFAWSKHLELKSVTLSIYQDSYYVEIPLTQYNSESSIDKIIQEQLNRVNKMKIFL